MWVFVLIVIIIFIVCISKHNKKKEREARERRERQRREEVRHRPLQTMRCRETAHLQQNNTVPSQYSKTQISSAQQKKKYNIPPAE